MMASGTFVLMLIAVCVAIGNCQSQQEVYEIFNVGNDCPFSTRTLGPNAGALVQIYKQPVALGACTWTFKVDSGDTIFVNVEQMSLGSHGTCIALIDEQLAGAQEHEVCDVDVQTFNLQTTQQYLTIKVTASGVPDDEVSFRLVVTPVRSALAGCPYSTFRCDSGDCIPAAMSADGHQNCPDNSDEKNVPSDSDKCGAKMLRCDSGQCIALTSKCDHFTDCLDSSDEQDCVYPCREEVYISSYECRDGNGCFQEYDICNGYRSCEDGSDEMNCDSCSNSHYDSWDGQSITYCEETRTCLNTDQVCDGVLDCPSGSDEDYDLCHPSIYWYWSKGQLAGLFIGYIIFVVVVIAIVIVVHKKCRKQVN